MTIQRYVKRSDPTQHILAFRWNCDNYADVVDFFYLHRPGTDWTLEFGGTDSRYPFFFKNGTNMGGPAPTDWIYMLDWADSSTPSITTDSSFASNWSPPSAPDINASFT